MKRLRRFIVFSSALAAVFFFLESSALASMHYFSQMLTSDHMQGSGDYSLELSADLDDLGNISAVVSHTSTAGAGLGDGSIGAGDSLNYSHSFGGFDSASRIESAYLSVLTAGDHQSDSSFTEITLDENFWNDRAMSFRLLGGYVSAELFDDDGDLQVNVTAHGSDVNLMWSMFRVNYEIDDLRTIGITAGPTTGGGTISAAIPEPGAATLFAAGMLIVGAAIRRR